MGDCSVHSVGGPEAPEDENPIAQEGEGTGEAEDKEGFESTSEELEG